MVQLTDEDILLRLANTEDSTVERKAASDYRDCLKTAVAFCNSLPVDDPALIFVGVFNDGRVQDNNNVESLQRKVSEEIGKIYPPLYPQMKAMQKDGKEFLAVIVRGSPERPHFSGQSYIRDGTQSVVASKEQFEALISERNSKTRQLLAWKDKHVVVRSWEDRAAFAGLGLNKGGSHQFVLKDCNQYYVTIANGGFLDSISLGRTELSYDHTADCLRLEVHSL